MRSLRVAFAWLLEPWRSAAIAPALVVAFAIPSLFLATGLRFEQGAGDAVFAQVASEVPSSERSLSLVANGRLERSAVNALDLAVRSRLERTGLVAEPWPMLYTSGGSAAVVPLDPDGTRRPVPGVPRFLAREGALDNVDLVEGSASGRGVLVSADFAERGDLAVGSLLEVEIDGFGVVVEVGGIYENLWPATPAYWEEIPAALVPRFDRFFGRPSTELLLADGDYLVELGVPGFVRWDAPFTSWPGDRRDLEVAAARMRSLESDLILGDELAPLLARFAGLATPQPVAVSPMQSALDTARAAVGEFDRRLEAAQALGVGLGAMIVGASAAFVAIRRRRVWRVLVADGDGPLRLAALALAQLLAPAVFGGLLGLAASNWVAPLIVEGGEVGVTEGADLIAGVTLAMWLLASVVTAAVALRTGSGSLRQLRGVRWPVALPFVGFALAAWSQAGGEQRSGLDGAVVLLPLAVLSAVAVVATIVAQWAFRQMGSRFAGAPLGVTLGLRRAAAAPAAAGLLGGAVAVSLGIGVYSIVLAATHDVSAQARSATIVGGSAVATLSGPVPPELEASEGLTLVRVAQTAVRPGDARAHVLAVDPETFAGVVDWPDTFGPLGAQGVVDLVSDWDGRALPAIRLVGSSLPDDASFGLFESYPYTVVAEVESAPLASDGVDTLIVSAPAMEALALARFESGFTTEFGEAPTAAQIDEFFTSPLTTLRQRVIARDLSAAGLEELLTTLGGRPREATDPSDVAGTADRQAIRFGFDYLEFVGVVCTAVSVTAVWMYRAERRSGRELADRVGAQLGITPSTMLRAETLEVGLSAIVALLAGLGGAFLVAGRIAPSFDGSQQVPPDIGLVVPAASTFALAGTALGAILLVGPASHWLGARSVRGLRR